MPTITIKLVNNTTYEERYLQNKNFCLIATLIKQNRRKIKCYYLVSNKNYNDIQDYNEITITLYCSIKDIINSICTGESFYGYKCLFLNYKFIEKIKHSKITFIYKDENHKCQWESCKHPEFKNGFCKEHYAISCETHQLLKKACFVKPKKANSKLNNNKFINDINSNANSCSSFENKISFNNIRESYINDNTVKCQWKSFKEIAFRNGFCKVHYFDD